MCGLYKTFTGGRDIDDRTHGIYFRNGPMAQVEFEDGQDVETHLSGLLHYNQSPIQNVQTVFFGMSVDKRVFTGFDWVTD